MFPHERSLVKRLKDKPFVLIGVNGDSDDPELEAKNKEHKITWRSFKNERDGEGLPISEEWNVHGWPTLYLIDHKGVIRRKWEGPPRNDELDRAIDDIVVEAEQAQS